MSEARRFRRMGEIVEKSATRDVADEVDFVLLNIFMAFTISLGFFLTEGKGVQSALEKMVETAREHATKAGARAEELMTVINNLKETTVGREALKAAETQRLAQKNELMIVWYQLRPTRELYQRLKEVQNVAHIPLVRELNYLPKDRSYSQLQTQVRKAFLKARGPEKVERSIVAGLLSEVCAKALKLKKEEMQSASVQGPLAAAVGRAFATKLQERDSPEYEGMTFDPKKPHLANLDSVAQTIRKDLEEERADVARAQTELVDTICEARIRNRSFRKVSNNGPENSAESLRRLVTELEQELSLLPEVVNQYH
jgi:hypothetical protein